jgi:hypothetical protein
MPPFSLIQELLLKVILPALLVPAGIVLLLCKTRIGIVAVAAALPAGMAAANWFREDLPWLPEQPAWHWLPIAAIIALAAGLLARIPRMPTLIGWLLRAVGVGIATWLLVPVELRTEKAWLLPAFFAVSMVSLFVLEFSTDARSSGSLLVIVAVSFVAAAAVIIHAHSARLADIAFMSGAALAGIGAAARATGTDARTAIPGAVVLLPGVVLAGYSETISDVPWVCFVLVAISPLMLAATWIPVVRRLGGWRLPLVQFALVLVPLAIAVGLAMYTEPLDFEGESAASKPLHFSTRCRFSRSYFDPAGSSS